MNIDKQLKKMLGAHSKRTTPNKQAGGNARRPLTFDFNFKQPNFNMTNNLLKKFNLKTFGGKNDWDGDGILNKKDCQPRNTMRQDTKPNRMLRERIDKLPIYIVDEKKNDPFILSIDENPITKIGQETKQRLYGTLKRYPGLITDIETSGVRVEAVTHYKPKNITAQYVKSKNSGDSDSGVIYLYPGFEKDKKMSGFTLAHELKHAKQFKDMAVKDIPIEPEKYFFRPTEIEADKYAFETLREHNVKTERPRRLFQEYIERREKQDPTILYRTPKQDEAITKTFTEEAERKQEIAVEQEQTNLAYRNLMDDNDSDGVNNMMDCDPNNPNKQGPYHEYLQTRRPQQLRRKYIEADINPEHDRIREDGSAIARIIQAKARLKRLEQEHQDDIIDDLNAQFPVSKESDLNLRLNKGNEDTDGDGVINVLDCQPRNKKKQDAYYINEEGVFHDKRDIQHSDIWLDKIKQDYGKENRWDEPVRMRTEEKRVEISNVATKEDFSNALGNKGFYNKFKQGLSEGIKQRDINYNDNVTTFNYAHGGPERLGQVKDFVCNKNVDLRLNKGNEDTDGDGVINILDCKPRDKKRQDATTVEPYKITIIQSGRKGVVLAHRYDGKVLVRLNDGTEKYVSPNSLKYK